jgi:hypothetical protein
MNGVNIMKITTRTEQIAFLRRTLIPDLLASGMDGSAVDYEICCRFMEDPKLKAIATRGFDVENTLEFINHWKVRS